MINFVSSLPQDLRSGGFSALNLAVLGALQERHVVCYAGPVDPPVETWRKGLSKLIRMGGGAGDFVFFSRTRLDTIATDVRFRCQGDAKIDFFHGFTSWIRTLPERPYVALSDCTFRDYVDIYHRRASFRAADLRRIERAEAVWLQAASRVAFTSAWAADRAASDYQLDRKRIAVVGIFGEVDAPETDVYEDSEQFAFVSTNFEAKGGPVVLRALRQVRERHPGASLVVVGDAPKGIEGRPGVTAVGFLHKEDPVQVRRLRDILGRSRAVVHPTNSDIAPHILIEAGYFGCPAISTRRFAVPEVVDDGRTGLLLDDPSCPDAVANAMIWMLEAGAEYRQMRQAAWRKTRQAHAKAGFEKRVLACVDVALKEASASAP